MIYHIFTPGVLATLVVEVEGPCGHSMLSAITVHMTVTPCSTGFEQDNEDVHAIEGLHY